MKKFILRGQLLDGSMQEFEFDRISFFMQLHADDFKNRKVTYIKYRGVNYPVKSETIEFLEVK